MAACAGAYVGFPAPRCRGDVYGPQCHRAPGASLVAGGGRVCGGMWLNYRGKCVSQDKEKGKKKDQFKDGGI